MVPWTMTSQADIDRYRYVITCLLEGGIDESTVFHALEDILYLLDDLDRMHKILDDAGVPRSAAPFMHGELDLDNRLTYLLDKLHKKHAALLLMDAVQQKLM